jgi:hypothetical protein
MIPTPSDNSDLWGFNPSNGRLFTQNERRTQLAHRGQGGFQNTLPQSEWDNWFDRQHENRVGQTLGIDPTMQGFDQELMAAGQAPGLNEHLLSQLGKQKMRTSVGASPEGSDQLTGYSMQPGGSLEGLRQVAKPRKAYQPMTAAEQAISARPGRKF